MIQLKVGFARHKARTSASLIQNILHLMCFCFIPMFYIPTILFFFVQLLTSILSPKADGRTNKWTVSILFFQGRYFSFRVVLWQPAVSEIMIPDILVHIKVLTRCSISNYVSGWKGLICTFEFKCHPLMKLLYFWCTPWLEF